MTLHLALKDRLDRHFSGQLDAPVQLLQDALVLRLSNAVTMELRFAGNDEYALSWQWGDAQLRIDTAPLHPELSTFPNHLHDGEGVVRADPVTRPELDAWDNAQALIEAVFADPLLRR